MATTTTNEIKITSRTGSGIYKSGTFYWDSIQSFKDFDRTPYSVKTCSFTFSVSINPSYLSWDKKTTCYRGWTMYYYRLNKNGSWAKQSTHMTCDSATMDMIIGAEKRMEIETTINNELLNELQNGINAINDSLTKENK